MTTILETDQGLVNIETGEVVVDGDALFNKTPYTIPVPTLDGHRADTLRLAFAGNVDIDTMIDDQLEHFKRLQFGQEIELRITGTVGKNGWTIKSNAETGEETVTHTIGVQITTYETV